MSNAELLQQWILEALSASGRAGDVLAVSRFVWERHEPDLRANGDLFWTWQVDLREAATALASGGRLVVDGPRWALADGAVAAPAPTGAWQPEEIQVVVDAYVAMLLDDHEGRPVRRREAVAGVVEATGRSGDALERMWSNITHVVQEFGYQPLSHWSPRSNVPAGVRPAVQAALDALS
ncbi:hypothetical protein [Nocardioides yefusunii]|uniref:Uncharacterized protein n=1 Tax=Nocardioides yefusunii TaxID=2500546 RepID=A0ABW1QRH9_9ACTN|nr:hypothetical protein [Nocardioides yefusunii]